LNTSTDAFKPIDDRTIDILFRQARSYNGWLEGPVDDATLKRVYDIAKWGPTSMNTQPMRVLWLRTPEAKARLRPHLSPGNVNKAMSAPVVAIIGYDLSFYQHLARTFPHLPTAKSYYEGKPPVIEATAFRGGSLQGAYLLLAARSLGLDCGPMSGFNNAGVDEEFFAGTTVRSNFLCCLGRGDPSKTFSRSPRFEFEEVCQVI